MHPRPQWAECFRGARGLANSEQLASEDPNNTTEQEHLISGHGKLCQSLAYAGEFSEVRSHRETVIAINQLMVSSDKNSAQARAEFGNSNMTMGLAVTSAFAIPVNDGALLSGRGKPPEGVSYERSWG
jgi:hypothetical protein